MRLFFLILPLLELFSLIQLGVHTSALTAVGYVLLTIALGAALLKRQGRGMVEHLQRAQSGEMLPGQWLLDDMVFGLSGLLLIIPGIITDFLALLLLIGPLRRLVMRRFEPPVQREAHPMGGGDEGDVIEGTYRRLDDE